MQASRAQWIGGTCRMEELSLRKRLEMLEMFADLFSVPLVGYGIVPFHPRRGSS